MRLIIYPYFGVWFYFGRYWFCFTIRIKNFYKRLYVGRERNIIQ